jgi:AhpD family alkylhydroperoxidase
VAIAIRADPGFYKRYLDLAAVSVGDSSALPAKETHLIALAAYASVTHLCGPGVRQHMAAALQSGATPAEILEVCEQIAGISIHSVTVGLPILQEELEAWQQEQSTAVHPTRDGSLIHET